jgi:hypothetical protein
MGQLQYALSARWPQEFPSLAELIAKCVANNDDTAPAPVPAPESVTVDDAHSQQGCLYRQVEERA